MLNQPLHTAERLGPIAEEQRFAGPFAGRDCSQGMMSAAGTGQL